MVPERPTTPATLLPGLRLGRPGEAQVQTIIERQADAPLTYADVGATDHVMPHGWYRTDRTAVVGEGDEAWARAVDALRRWRMFEVPWIRLHTCGPPAVDQVVGFASRQFGVWGVHVVRVVAVWDEDDGETRRVGFTYGTLPQHAVRGEERFSLRQDARGGPVVFRIRQFSRPQSWLVRALGPASRAVQDAFVRDALRAMARAVRP